jgi:hypothetical protein
MVNWDSCHSMQANKPFAGPAVYGQVISGFGFGAAVRGYMIRLHITASNVYDSPSHVLPDAWRFDRPSGCQAERLTVSVPSASCPAMTTGPISFAVSYDYNGFDLDITLHAAFDPVQPDPNTRYALFALDYDHSRSASGPRDPAEACGGAERPVCFVIRDARWTDVNLQSHPIYSEPFLGVTWQDEYLLWCFGDLAVQRSPWTAIKTLYR